MENRAEPSREEQTLELLVFLFLIVPSIVLSLFTLGTPQVGFALLAVSTIFRDLALVALIAFFLWRNGESSERIGWTNQEVGTNLLLGVLLFPAILIGAAALGALLRSLGLSGPAESTPSFLLPQSYAEIALGVVLVAVVAVSEETIFRGYLITRLVGVTGNVPLAVILSTVVFSLGHGYEGTAGIVAVGAMGLIFALLFVWRRSLVAPTVIHFLNNFVGIVLLPLLGMR
ncbi:MAG: CPBP family intramembrane glutamic endopeptidase [Chloroflexota bacterium]